MSATIKDVARIANCSIKTVSRVINKELHVSEATRKKVEAAIRVAGYAPNLSARRLASQKSSSICLLLYPGFYQSTSALLPRLLDLGYEENFEILIQLYFPTHSQSKQNLVELVNQRRYDGFMTTPPCDADGFIADLLQTYKTPLVQVNPFNRSEKLPYIAGDDYQGAYKMTEHLINLGHHRISFLMGPRNMRSSFDRFYGFRAALDSYHVPFDETLVLDSEFTFDGGYWSTKSLIEREDRPTAIFAGNDEVAMGSIFAVQESGMQIPVDISICGHDDLDISKRVYPGITTVHQPSEMLVEQAARLLIAILKGNQPEQTQILIPSKLVLRKSTGKPGN